MSIPTAIANLPKHAVALVRVLDGDDVTHLRVKDWVDGQFTTQRDVEALMACHRRDIRLFVLETPEVEWHVQRVDYGWQSLRVTCIPHSTWLRHRMMPDEYIACDSCKHIHANAFGECGAPLVETFHLFHPNCPGVTGTCQCEDR